MTDSKVEIRYQTVTVSKSSFEVRFDLYEAGFELCGYNPDKREYTLGKDFVIPEAPEPPRPLCLN
jgi:hypothetical protein